MLGLAPVRDRADPHQSYSVLSHRLAGGPDGSYPECGGAPGAYYGWYSNVSRGKRRKAQGEEPITIEESTEVSASAAKRAWARLIKQVDEADPLTCPR